MTIDELDKMTPEEKNARIAERCGWKARHYDLLCDGMNRIRCGACGSHGHANCYGDGRGAIQFTCAEMPCCNDAITPSYTTDLNLIHAAVLALPYDKRGAFRRALQHVVSGERPFLVTEGECLFATAEQWADAFLIATTP